MIFQNQFLNKIIQDYEATAMELLGLLENLSKKGRLQSIMPGRHDTAIGRTIEHALGIPINSSPLPDYKGIELKAARLNKISNRTNLFAQVPVSVIGVLLTRKAEWSATEPLTIEQIRQGFTRIGLGVNRILPAALIPQITENSLPSLDSKEPSER